MLEPLIQFNHVDVALDGETILHDINWQLRFGQHWAILGGNGSGKSTFLKLVRGEYWPAPGRGRRIYAFDGQRQIDAVGVKEKIGLVSPELQERYLQEEWTLTGLQVIHTGFFSSDYLYQKPTSKQIARAASIIWLLGLEGLISRNAQTLSTGELRKLLIARALAGSPRILIFDEVCDGLDSRSRAQLLKMIGQIARAGTQVLYTTHRAGEIIPAITHELILDQGHVVKCGNCKRGARTSGGFDAPLPETYETMATAAEDRTLKRPKVRAPMPRRKSSQLANRSVHCSAISGARTLIHIKRANVFLDRKRVLRNVTWEMQADQHWAIVGSNGAGKSTLLKLICGDLHPAAGAAIRRFDLTPKDTIWALRKKIGFVSPHFQANYRATLTGAEVVASGYFSSVGLIEPVTSLQKKKVRQLLDSFHLAPLGDKNILRMSYGEFRAVLTMRALINDPEILILDEPFDGLDAPAKAAFAKALERAASKGTRLIIVTHHPGDLPTCITHVLVLEKGRIVSQDRSR